MTPRSCKAKGRRLQDWIKDKLIDLIGISPDLIKCAIMGENGQDVRLFGDARQQFPYSIEAKNTERLNLWAAYDQAAANAAGDQEPLVICKRNRSRPLAIMDAEHFMRLVASAAHQDGRDGISAPVEPENPNPVP